MTTSPDINHQDENAEGETGCGSPPAPENSGDDRPPERATKRARPSLSDIAEDASQRSTTDTCATASTQSQYLFRAPSSITCKVEYDEASESLLLGAASTDADYGERVVDVYTTLSSKLRTVLELVKPIETEVEGTTGLMRTTELLLSRFEEPNTTFVIRGPAGSGKSSLINAILGEELLPTSSSEACTTCPTRIAYCAAQGYRAEVQFVSLDEWRGELEAYCRMRAHETRRQEGEERSRHAQSGSAPPSSMSLEEVENPDPCLFEATASKLEVLFPGHAWSDPADPQVWTTALILALDPALLGKLGTMLSVSETSVSALRSSLAPYGDPRTSRLWPLISELRIFAPCSVLRHGATLVDLPGTGDSNAARDGVAAAFARRAYDYMWVCLDLCRAQSSKEAEQLFQMLSDEQLRSGHGRLSFILTKCEQGVGIVDRPSERIFEDVPSLRSDAAFREQLEAYRRLSTAVVELQSQVPKSRRGAVSRTEEARRTVLLLHDLQQERAEARRRVAIAYSRARSAAVEATLQQRYEATTRRLIHASGDADGVAGGLLVYSTSTQELHGLEACDDSQVLCASEEEDTGVPALRRLVERMSRRRRIAMNFELLNAARLACTAMLLHLSPFLAGPISSSEVAATGGFDQRHLLAERWGPSRPISLTSITQHLTLQIDAALQRTFTRLSRQMSERTVALLSSSEGREVRHAIVTRWFGLTRRTDARILQTALRHGGRHPLRTGVDVNGELGMEVLKFLERGWSNVLHDNIDAMQCELAAVFRAFADRGVFQLYLSSKNNDDDDDDDDEGKQWAVDDATRSHLRLPIASVQREVHRVLPVLFARFKRSARVRRIAHLRTRIADQIGATLRDIYTRTSRYSGKGSVHRRGNDVAFEIRRQITLFGLCPRTLGVEALVEEMHASLAPKLHRLAGEMDERLVRLFEVPHYGKGEGGGEGEGAKRIHDLAKACEDVRAFCDGVGTWMSPETATVEGRGTTDGEAGGSDTAGPASGECAGAL